MRRRGVLTQLPSDEARSPCHSLRRRLKSLVAATTQRRGSQPCHRGDDDERRLSSDEAHSHVRHRGDEARSPCHVIEAATMNLVTATTQRRGSQLRSQACHRGGDDERRLTSDEAHNHVIEAGAVSFVAGILKRPQPCHWVSGHSHYRVLARCDSRATARRRRRNS